MRRLNRCSKNTNQSDQDIQVDITHSALYNGLVYETAIEIIKRLRSTGFEAYLAGGYVRNKLLGIPIKDYDIATSARPDDVISLFRKTVPVGKAFGVIIVVENENRFEVTTFRSDGKYIDGRHPESVTFSDYKQDVLRRDFTINGMLYDPIDDKVIDLVGGQEDLKKRIIRSVGDPIMRFEEDKLRMIRAVRFSCQLDFSIEEKTRDAIKQFASTITDVSYERIRDELRLILLSNKRSNGLKVLYDCGIINKILPEFSKTVGVDQPPEFHPEGDVFTHTLLALDLLDNPSFELAFGVLLHDIGKPDTFEVKNEKIRFPAHESIGESITENICKRFKLSSAETEQICFLVRNHMKFKDVKSMRVSTLRRFLSESHFPTLKELCRVDIMASNKDLSVLDFVKDVEKEFEQEKLRPTPFLRGKDLLDIGLEPSPLFSKILKKVEDLQLEGAIISKEEAIDYVKRNWKITSK